MKKKWLCRHMLLLRMLTGAVVGLAQQPSHADPAAAELQKNIAIINREDKDGRGAELLERTTKLLVAYLKRYDLPTAEARKLGLQLTAGVNDAAQFRVYTFAYDAGNSHGAISIPVLQWKNRAGQRFAYAPANHSSFFEVHQLRSPGRTLYLLLGTEKGSAGCLDHEARVAEVKGDYLLLDTPAFAGGASLNLCNVPMAFDARRQVLHLDLTGFDAFEPADNPRPLLRQWGYSPGAGTRKLALRFDGRRFVKL